MSRRSHASGFATRLLAWLAVRLRFLVVPAFAARDFAGKKFSDLDRDAVKALARVASALGRRGDTIVTLWSGWRASKWRYSLTAFGTSLLSRTEWGSRCASSSL